MDTNKIKTEFRKSKEWEKKREQFVKVRSKKCEWCEATGYLAPAHKDCHIIYEISEIWNTQIYIFLRYMTFVTNERPFPFTGLTKNLSKFKK